MFSFGFIRDSVLQKLGLQPTTLPSPEKNEESGVTRTADECKQQLRRRDDVTRDQCGAGVNILGCERQQQQHWRDKCSDTSRVKTLASPAKHTSASKGVTTLIRAATHDPVPSEGGDHHTVAADCSGSSVTCEAAITLTETDVKYIVTSVPSATAVNPPAPRPTTPQLLLPGDATPGAITSSSGSSSPEMFFDATDGLSQTPSAYTPDTHIGDDAEEYYRSLGATQEQAEVYKECVGMTRDSGVCKLNKNRSSESTNCNQVAINVLENVLLTSSEQYGTISEERHGDENMTEVTRDHNKDGSEVIADTKQRALGQNNNVGVRNMWEDRENNESEQQDTSDTIPYPESSSQGRDFWDIKVNCDHWEGSESLDVKISTEQCEGGESHSSVEGRLDSRQEWVPASLPLDRCLDESHDSDLLFDESGGSEFHSPLPPPPPPTVNPSCSPTQEQVPNVATVSNSSGSQDRDVTEIRVGASRVSKHEAAPEIECKQSLPSYLDPRPECHSEASKTNESNTCGHRLLGEVFPAEKPSGSSLREETRKIVMMLSNDRSCKVPRPSLGLQDRLRTLSQRSAGRRTTYAKGPRFCSTVVKSIVRNTHDRLQARRDSFQDFIQSRREQTVQRAFVNPIPCYGSGGATAGRTPSTTNVPVGEDRIVHDDVDVVGSEGRQEGAATTTIRSSATPASVFPPQTTVTPLSATVEVVPPVPRPQEDMNYYIIQGSKLISTNINGRNRISNGNTTILGKNIAGSHETATNEELGAKIPTVDDTSATHIPNVNEVVQMEAVTPEPSTSDAFMEAVTPEPSTSDVFMEAVTPEPSTSDVFMEAVTPEPSTSDVFMEAVTPEPGTSDVFMEAVTPEPGTSDVFQNSSDEARLTIVLLGQSRTDCNTRQHAAPSSLATQAVLTGDTEVPVVLPPSYEGEHVSKNTDTMGEVLGKVPGTPAQPDYHETSSKPPSPTTYSSTGGETHKMGTTRIPTSANNKATFSNSKPHFPQRPRENTGNTVDLQAHIASLNKVSPKLIGRMAEARKVGEQAREAGGGQDTELASTNNLQDSSQAHLVVSPGHIGPSGVAEGSHNSSLETSVNPPTLCESHLHSIDNVYETGSLENLAEVRETNNLVDVPSASLMCPSSEAAGAAQPHSEDTPGNSLIQEAQGAGDLKTLSCDARRTHHATSSHLTSEEAQAVSPEPHHPWSCLEDITKLKTNNLVARFRGIRSLLHPVLPTQHLKRQTTSVPPEAIPISPHPQLSSDGRTMIPTQDKGQTSFDHLEKQSADDPPPLPPNTRQDSVGECPLLPDSRQGSIDRRSLHLSPQSSVDECPNIRQGSSEGRPSLSPDSRQGSVGSRCVGQRNRPRGRLNSRRDSSGGRLSSYAERKRSRANSHHARSRQGSTECVRPTNRRDSRNIHQSCYSDDRRDSNNVCLHSCTKRGSRVSFGQDLLRKCLEAAVDKCDTLGWEETREETEVATMAISKEDLNKSLSKAVCHLDAAKTRTFLQLGADPNVRCGHSAALLRAAKDGALYVVQALLAAGADVDLRSDIGNSSLHLAARGGFSEVAIQLVHSGAHVDAINRSGVTPLQMALAQGHLEVARTLLRLHADMFLPNKVGETAYEVANHLGYMGISESPREVRRASAPGTWVEPTPTEVPVAVRMIQGIEDGCPATVEACLAEGASPNTVVPLALHWPAYATVLHRAAHYGHDLIVRLLLAAEADVNRQDVVGNTPLHAAAQSGHNRVVKILLREGALLEAKSQSGMTPLHRAASKGKELTCNLLLRRGCDPQAQDNGGLTPADWARKRGFKPLAKKLVYRRKSSASLLADAHRTHYLQHLNHLHEEALKAAEREVDSMDCCSE